MKKILLILSLAFILSCSDDELTYDDSKWSTAYGIIRPDTLKNVMNINPDNYQAIYRSSLSSPSYPTNDSLNRRYVFASHFKTASIFGEVDDFYFNDSKLTFYNQLLYPSYYHNTESYFSFDESDISLKYTEDAVEYSYDLKVDDVFNSLEVSNNTLDSDVDITFDKVYDIYSIHAFYLYYNELGVKSNYSLNQTYDVLSTDNKITISKSEVENAIKELGYTLEYVTGVSFSLIATDTTEVMIGNRNTLIYKSAEKIINLDY